MFLAADCTSLSMNSTTEVVVRRISTELLATTTIKNTMFTDTIHDYYYNTTTTTTTTLDELTTTTVNESEASQEMVDVVNDVVWLFRDLLLGVVLVACCLLTVVGNAMVLHAVRTDRKLQTVCNMFIVSLAIADLIVGLFVMPMSTVYVFTVDWWFGIGLCQLWIAVDYTASTASILNLFVLSLDRYWSVSAPLKYLRKRTKRRALIMISMVWMVSFLWVVPIVGWHHFVNGGVRIVPAHICDTEYATNTALKIITSIFNYYLPLAVMYALYTKIFMEIRRRSKLEVTNRPRPRPPTALPVLPCLPRLPPTVLPLSLEASVADSEDQTPLHSPTLSRLFAFSRKLSSRLSSRIDYQQPEVALVGDWTRGRRREIPDRKQFRDSFLMASPEAGVIGPSESLLSCCADGSRNATPHDDDVTTTKMAADSDAANSFSTSGIDSQSRSETGNTRLSDMHTDSLDVGTTPGGDELDYGECRVRFKFDACADDKQVDSDIVVQLPKEPHPTRDQTVRRKAADSQLLTAALHTSVINTEGALQGSDDTTTTCNNDGLRTFINNHSNDTVDTGRHFVANRTIYTTNKQCSSISDELMNGCQSHIYLCTGRHFRSRDACLLSPNDVVSGLHRSLSSSDSSTLLNTWTNNTSSTSDDRNSKTTPCSTATRYRKQHPASTTSSTTSATTTNQSTTNHRPSSALRKEIKAARQLGVIMGAFTVCFLPYFVCYTVVALCPDCVDARLMATVTWVGYLNSTLNPFLYPLCNANFRRKFRRMLGFRATPTITATQLATGSVATAPFYACAAARRQTNMAATPPVSLY